MSESQANQEQETTETIDLAELKNYVGSLFTSDAAEGFYAENMFDAEDISTREDYYDRIILLRSDNGLPVRVQGIYRRSGEGNRFSILITWEDNNTQITHEDEETWKYIPYILFENKNIYSGYDHLRIDSDENTIAGADLDIQVLPKSDVEYIRSTLPHLSIDKQTTITEIGNLCANDTRYKQGFGEIRDIMDYNGALQEVLKDGVDELKVLTS